MKHPQRHRHPSRAEWLLRMPLMALLMLFIFFSRQAAAGMFQTISVPPPAGMHFNRGWQFIWHTNGEDHVLLLALSPAGRGYIYRGPDSRGALHREEEFAIAPDTVWLAFIKGKPGESGPELISGRRDGLYQRRCIRGKYESTATLRQKTSGQIFPATMSGLPQPLPVQWRKKGHTQLPLLFSDRLEFAGQSAPIPIKASISERVKAPSSGVPYYTLESKNEQHLPGTTKSAISPVARDLADQLIAKIPHRVSAAFPDFDHDGARDLVLFTFNWGLSPRSLVRVYRRTSPTSFSKKPVQLLRCRGLPAEWNFSQRWGFRSPFHDLNGDQLPDMMFLQLKSKPLSPRSAMEVLLSQSVEWKISFFLSSHQSQPFSKSNLKLSLRTRLPVSDQGRSLVQLNGDFNGDHRPDILVRNRADALQIFFSSLTPPLYTPKRSVQLAVPISGIDHAKDLNGDGATDLQCLDFASGNLIVYLARTHK